jgi:uncharacterized protein (TIGR03435 family)
MKNGTLVRLSFTTKVTQAVSGTAFGVSLVLGTVGPPAIRAQTSPVQSSQSARPRFEVASIKSCKSDTAPAFVGGGSRSTGSPGRLVLNCETVTILIQRAYLIYRDGHPNSDPFFLVPISGGPGWVDSDRYTIDAKAEGSQSQAMMMGPMLQALLEDRFRLKIHREKREVPVYALTVAKGGPKLQATKEASCIPFDPAQPPAPPARGQRSSCGVIAPDTNGGLVTYGQTMAGLCLSFSGLFGRPVIDRTGLAGAFDIHLELSPRDLIPVPPGPQVQTDPTATAPMSDPLSSVRFALQKLGLQLESTKGPGEALVIDHVEKPSEN